MANSRTLPPDSPVRGLHAGASVLDDEEVQEVLAVIKESIAFEGLRSPIVWIWWRVSSRASPGRWIRRMPWRSRPVLAAIKVALVAAGVGPGDEVIMPPVTFVATPGAVVLLGGVPIFAEVDRSMTLDPDAIEEKNHAEDKGDSAGCTCGARRAGWMAL